MARVSRKGAARQPAVTAGRIWRTAVYARLSLEDGGRRGTDAIETQIELVTSYVAARPYLPLAGIYVDNGVSGKDFERPAWNRLMGDIRAGYVDCVCVKDLSRFSRNYIETHDFLDNIFPILGVRFVSVNDGYDNNASGSPNEGLSVALNSLVNDLYLKDISRKMSSSYTARRERGEFTGPFAPFGYRKSGTVKGRLEPDGETAPAVRDIFLRHAEGTGKSAICKILDEAGVPCPSARLMAAASLRGGEYFRAAVWQPKTIGRMIANPVYLGHLVYGKTHRSLADRRPPAAMPRSEWIVVENVHEPIVSRELWDAANAARR